MKLFQNESIIALACGMLRLTIESDKQARTHFFPFTMVDPAKRRRWQAGIQTAIGRPVIAFARVTGSTSRAGYATCRTCSGAEPGANCRCLQMQATRR